MFLGYKYDTLLYKCPDWCKFRVGFPEFTSGKCDVNCQTEHRLPLLCTPCRYMLYSISRITVNWLHNYYYSGYPYNYCVAIFFGKWTCPGLGHWVARTKALWSGATQISGLGTNTPPQKKRIHPSTKLTPERNSPPLQCLPACQLRNYRPASRPSEYLQPVCLAPIPHPTQPHSPPTNVASLNQQQNSISPPLP